MTAIVEINLITDNGHGVETSIRVNHRFANETEAVNWINDEPIVTAWFHNGFVRIVPDTGQVCTADTIDEVGLFGLE